MTRKYLGLCLDDQIGPMARQDDWIRKITKGPEKGPDAVIQQEWWAQRDLVPLKRLDIPTKRPIDKRRSFMEGDDEQSN